MLAIGEEGRTTPLSIGGARGRGQRGPDYTSLLCVRPEPLGGGPSILSDARAAAAGLTPSSRALPADKAYL